MKENLDNIEFDCTGCSLCEAICPVNAIEIILDKEGFKKYHINEKCIKCGLCVKECPKINYEGKEINKIDVYSAYTLDKNILKESSSGGIFSEIAKIFLNGNGIVVGASLENMVLKHICVSDENDLYKLRGSKYLQSDMSGIFKEVKEYIESGKKILFSGLPCQVAAIKKYINSDNLYTIDIVCHGVPSIHVFKKSLKDRFGTEKISKIIFRDKSNGWNNYSLKYFIKDNEKVKTYSYVDDEWFMGYLKNKYLKKSCYDCKFNDKYRQGDVTLGDFWGIENVDKEFSMKNNNKGVSLVMVNTEKGKELFKNIESNIIYKEQKLCDAEKYNPRISSGKYSLKALNEREMFFAKEQNISFKTRRYTDSNLSKTIKFVKRIIKKILKNK